MIICLHTVTWFQEFLSNTNNYMVSSNYFNLIIIICLHAVMWFHILSNTKSFLAYVDLFDWLIDSNGISTQLGLF